MTDIYFSPEDFYVIENTLNDELESMSKYLELNELIINLKKGKTEVMIFGTAKRLALNPRSLQLRYKDTIINNIDSYVYLGISLDTCLTLNTNVEQSYKRASSRLYLLSKVRPYLTVKAAQKVYDMMILPILTYSGVIKLRSTRTYEQKLNSLENRARMIIGESAYIPNTLNVIRKRACILVRKCLTNNVCYNFNNYFKINNHVANTRNCNLLIKLPKVRLEYAKQSFYFMGVKTYNELPTNIRDTKSFSLYKKLLDSHFA